MVEVLVFEIWTHIHVLLSRLESRDRLSVGHAFVFAIMISVCIVYQLGLCHADYLDYI